MARLKLTVGFSPNPRIAPLIDGAVKPQNIELDFVVSHPGELFYRNLWSAWFPSGAGRGNEFPQHRSLRRDAPGRKSANKEII